MQELIVIKVASSYNNKIDLNTRHININLILDEWWDLLFSNLKMK